MKTNSKNLLNILYEDKDVLVVDKPKGLMVHGDGRTKEKTLVDILISKYPKIKNVGDGAITPSNPNLKNENGKLKILRSGIVHRLDKETSGVLIVAKNQKSFEFLKAQFAGRNVKKIYRALVAGFMKEDRGTVSASIGRSKSDFRKRVVGGRGEVREAVTMWRVLKRFTKGSKKYSYLEVFPKTGRTHQIRVHMKYTGHPIVSDELYGSMKDLKNFPRLMLHAFSLELALPSGKKLKISAPLPSEFTGLDSIKPFAKK